MTPLVLISAFVSTYMCLVQGPCRSIHHWMKQERQSMNRFHHQEHRERIHERLHHNDKDHKYYKHHKETPCRAPNGLGGHCIPIDQCEPLFALVSKPSRTPAEFDLLKKAHCGYQGKTPQVCCAEAAPASNTCFTPDGQAGTCTGLYSCPHIVEMLAQKPVSQETYRFVQNSKCDGPEQYSVCCGKPPGPPPQPNGNCQSTAAPPDPRTECCGRDGGAGNRIIGGTATGVDQYPWLTLIEYRSTSDNNIKLLCGGALISGKYVLTAGHCVAGYVLSFGIPINVRLGEYDTNNDGVDCVAAEGGGQDCAAEIVIIPIERTIPHPQYAPNNQLRRHDIALIRLRQMAPYTDFIRPICLPTSDITLSPPSMFTLYAAGWGATNSSTSSSNVKLHVDLPYSSFEVCQPAYNVERRKVPLWQGQICAGGEKDKDTCKGDSGGPLMYENGRVFEVIGIVSFGPTPCGLEDIPGVYTKVYQYNSWIRSQMQP